MARIEPRVLSLISVLYELNLGWLVTELLEVINLENGDYYSEYSTGDDDSEKGDSNRKSSQMSIVSDYVFKRISSSLDYLTYSLEQLQYVAQNEPSPDPERKTESRVFSIDPISHVFLDHANNAFSASTLSNSQKNLSALQTALMAWLVNGELE